MRGGGCQRIFLRERACGLVAQRAAASCSADFQVCCVADFQIGRGCEARGARVKLWRCGCSCGPRVWKPAIQQTWKSALQGRCAARIGPRAGGRRCGRGRPHSAAARALRSGCRSAPVLGRSRAERRVTRADSTALVCADVAAAEDGRTPRLASPECARPRAQQGGAAGDAADSTALVRADVAAAEDDRTPGQTAPYWKTACFGSPPDMR